jgi:hypothetical protein
LGGMGTGLNKTTWVHGRHCDFAEFRILDKANVSGMPMSWSHLVPVGVDDSNSA